jgi:hypothetical protein
VDGSQGRSQQLDFASEAMPTSMYRRERHSPIDLLDRVHDESNACSLYRYHLCRNLNLFLAWSQCNRSIRLLHVDSNLETSNGISFHFTSPKMTSHSKTLRYHLHQHRSLSLTTTKRSHEQPSGQGVCDLAKLNNLHVGGLCHQSSTALVGRPAAKGGKHEKFARDHWKIGESSD